MNIIERFKNKISDKDSNGCMNWNGAFNRYGRFMTGSRLDGTKTASLAHRVSYELFIGEIPEGMYVCHKCDNTKCVNPDHLFLGDQKKNMHDMINKKRDRKNSPRGECNGHSKLSNKQAKEIKDKLKLGIKGAVLAREYKISESVVYGIKHNKNWKHI